MVAVESLEARSLMAAPPPAGLDFSFGGGAGFVGHPLAHNVALSGVATQADGKILVCGYTKPTEPQPVSLSLTPNRDFFLARLNPDGTMDASFGGGDGYVTAGPYGAADTVGWDDEAWGVAPMADGRIVVVGLGGVARFLPDGTLDTSLDPANAPPGFARPEVHVFDWMGGPITNASTFLTDLRGVAPGPDGSAYLLGHIPGFFGALARMFPDGSLDADFVAQPLAPTPSPLFSHFAVGNPGDVGALTPLPGGGLLVAATRSWWDAASNRQRVGMGLYAFDDGGKPLPGFGNAPRVSPETQHGSWLGADGRAGSAADVDVAGDGRIVAAGAAGRAARRAAWVARFDANGVPDPTFGRRASAYVRAAAVTEATDVEVGSDGKVTVALVTARNRRAAQENRNGYAVLRLNPDGSRDRTFGGRGRARGVLHLPFPPAADPWPDALGHFRDSPEKAVLVTDPQGRLLVLAASNSTLHVARLAEAPALAAQRVTTSASAPAAVPAAQPAARDARDILATADEETPVL